MQRRPPPRGHAISSVRLVVRVTLVVPLDRGPGLSYGCVEGACVTVMGRHPLVAGCRFRSGTADDRRIVVHSTGGRLFFSVSWRRTCIVGCVLVFPERGQAPAGLLTAGSPDRSLRLATRRCDHVDSLAQRVFQQLPSSWRCGYGATGRMASSTWSPLFTPCNLLPHIIQRNPSTFLFLEVDDTFSRNGLA